MNIYKITLIGIAIVSAISFLLAAKVMSADESTASTHIINSDNNITSVYEANK